MYVHVYLQKEWMDFMWQHTEWKDIKKKTYMQIFVKIQSAFNFNNDQIRNPFNMLWEQN